MTVAEPHDPDFPAPEHGFALSRTLGQRLAAARTASGMTLAEISTRTRVPERMLAAIEADAHETLPHPTFTGGFVRSFAREVGLDEAQAASQFRAENTRVPSTYVAPVRHIEPERVPSKRLAWVGAAIALLVAIGAIAFFARRNRAAEPTPTTVAQAAPTSVPTPAPNVDATAPTAALPGPPASTVAAPGVATTAAAPAPTGAVTLTATDDAWIQVRDNASGQRLKSGVLAKGQTFAVPVADASLWTGRAGALEVRVGGKLLPPLGGPAETIRNVSLSPASLAARAGGASSFPSAALSTSSALAPAPSDAGVVR